MKRNPFLIAVFDEWEALGNVLADLGTERLGRCGALLHTRKDEPPMLTASWLVQNMAELHFAAFRERVRCTADALADELGRRSTGGVCDLAGTLRSWMSSEQARACSGTSRRAASFLGSSLRRRRTRRRYVPDWCTQVRIWSSFAMRIAVNRDRRSRGT